MNDPNLNRLRELVWRRKLTEAEASELEKLLSAHPDAGADLQDDASLTQLLGRLPEAPPVASNFTALVMQSIERDSAASARGHAPDWLGWLRRHWLPNAAVAGLTLTITFVGYHHHRSNERALMAAQVAGLAEAVSASGPDVIENFNPIWRLGDAPPEADTKLIALMQ
jgi:hypothetical protein